RQGRFVTNGRAAVLRPRSRRNARRGRALVTIAHSCYCECDREFRESPRPGVDPFRTGRAAAPPTLTLRRRTREPPPAKPRRGAEVVEQAGAIGADRLIDHVVERPAREGFENLVAFGQQCLEPFRPVERGIGPIPFLDSGG